MVHQDADTPVERQAHRQVGDVALRDQYRHAEVDLRRPILGPACPIPAACLRHGFLKHMLIELDADLADVARLLRTQQVAGAPDVEIVAGQREAGAQLIEGLHHFQALHRSG